MKFLSPEVALYLHKSTIRPCIKSMHETLLSCARAPSCYLELLDKLQKWICRIVGPSLASSLKPFAHLWNEANLNLLYKCYFGRCSSELAHLVPLYYSWGRSLVILIDCMIFLPPFLGVTRMSVSTVSFLTQLYSGTLCL